MEKEIKKIQESLEIVAKTTAYILENMATKEDLKNLATKEDLSNVKSEIHDMRMDFKSFRNDTEDSIKEIKNDTTDLADTVMHQDKRIEKLENKVFA